METKSLSRRDFLKIFSSATVSSGLSGLNIPNYRLLQPDRDLETPNIFIFLFDTLSARHMSLYGYKRDTTPNLKKFAEQATVYHRHHAGGNWTPPGTATLFTGVYPWAHRSTTVYTQTLPEFTEKNIFQLVNEKRHTYAYTQNLLAESLLTQMNEYIENHPFIDQPGTYYYKPTMSWLSDNFHIGQWSDFLLEGNFSHPPGTPFFFYLMNNYYRYKIKQLTTRFGDEYPLGFSSIFPGVYSFLDQALEWVKNETFIMRQPAFGYFHLFAPHAPYAPRSEFTNLFDDGLEFPEKEDHILSKKVDRETLLLKRQQYDEFIANVDHDFYKVIEHMQENGLLDNSYIIFTSDHGEMIERGILGHTTQTLYEPIIHIPLIIHAPGQSERKDIYNPTSAVDILPTLCRITGVEIPDWAQGRILPGFSDEAPEDDRPIFSVEANENPKRARLSIATVAMIQWPYKLIHYFGYDEMPDGYELYNLETDPEELQNLISTHTEDANKLIEVMQAHLEEANKPFPI